MLSPSQPANELADLLGPFWSPTRVSAQLGLSEDMQASARSAGTLLGLRTSDEQMRYPVWQFHRHDDGTLEVRPALAAMFRELGDFDPWAVAVLIHTPAPELDGQTPISAARASVNTSVLAGLARAVAREWAP